MAKLVKLPEHLLHVIEIANGIADNNEIERSHLGTKVQVLGISVYKR